MSTSQGPADQPDRNSGSADAGGAHPQDAGGFAPFASAGAGGAPAPEPGGDSGRPSGRGRVNVTITVAVAVLIALALGFTAGRATAPSTTTVAATVPAHPTVTASATGQGAPTESADTAAGTGAASAPGAVPDAAGVMTVSLVNLTPASTTFTNPDTAPMLDGKPQLLSISSVIGENDGSCTTTTGTAEYNLGRDYTRFTALIGIDDASADQSLDPTVEIDGDGGKLAVYTPTLGHPAQVSLNVSGVLRLDIIWSDPATACTINYLVVGDGQLTTVQGYTPPAPSPSDN